MSAEKAALTCPKCGHGTGKHSYSGCYHVEQQVGHFDCQCRTPFGDPDWWAKVTKEAQRNGR